jgi:serine/threonine protein kinase
MIKSLDNVEFIDGEKILGEGAYSKVMRIKLKSDNKKYALKIIDLDVISEEDASNLQNEIKMHS